MTAGRTTLASDVDHIVSVAAAWDLRLEPTNLRPLCHPCHDVKTRAERKWEARGMSRYVVCGLPGSGKSTYVMERRKPGALVWDFDVVVSALTGLPPHAQPPDLDGVMVAMLDALTRAVQTRPPDRDVWVIVTDPGWANDLAARLGCVVTHLAVQEPVRAQRLAERARGTR